MLRDYEIDRLHELEEEWEKELTSAIEDKLDNLYRELQEDEDFMNLESEFKRDFQDFLEDYVEDFNDVEEIETIARIDLSEDIKVDFIDKWLDEDKSYTREALNWLCEDDIPEEYDCKTTISI